MVHHELLIQAAEAQQLIHTVETDAIRPAPSVQQEHVADDLFTHEQTQLAATVLGMQTGLLLLHHILLEAAPPPEETPHRRRLHDKEPIPGS